MIAFVSNETVKLNTAGQLSSVTSSGEIPLAVEKGLVVRENETLRIFTINRNMNQTELNYAGEILTPLKFDLGPVEGAFDLAGAIEQGINELTGQEDEKKTLSLGVIDRVFDVSNNFGIGSHSDCSEMSTPLINTEDVRDTTACDFILKYTIRENGDESQQLDGWNLIEGKSVISDPFVLSTGSGKFDVFAVGTDGILWHREFDYGWKGWEPLSRYTNVPGQFLPSNSTIAASSWGPSRLDVFVKGQDNSIHHRWLNISAGGWAKEWRLYGGEVDSQPSAISLSPGNLNLFAIEDNTVCAMTFDFDENDPQTTGWLARTNSTTGCTTTTDDASCRAYFGCAVQNLLNSQPTDQDFILPPIFIPTSQGRVDAFTLLPLDNIILHQYFGVDSDNEWLLNSTMHVMDDFTFTSTPAVLSKSRTSIDLDLYAQAEDGTLVYGHYDGTGWENLRPLNITAPILGNSTSPPSVVYWEDPETTCLFVRSGTSLYYSEVTQDGPQEIMDCLG